VRGEETFIAQAGQRRVNGWQRAAEEAKSGVAIGMVEGFAAQADRLTGIDVAMGWRIGAGWAADGGALIVEDDEQDGGSAAAVTFFPCGVQGLVGRRRGRFGEEDFEGAVAFSDGEANLPEWELGRERYLAKLKLLRKRR